MSKYDKFDIEYIKVPVQFGKMSARERRCRFLGYVGALITEPYWIESYYIIYDGEQGTGRFFYERRWKGGKFGNIDPNGKTWHYLKFTSYARLPDEIKKEINKKSEKIVIEQQHFTPETDGQGESRCKRNNAVNDGKKKLRRKDGCNLQNSQKKGIIEEEFEIGKDIDVYVKYETLDNGSITMLTEIDAKTEEAEEFLKNNPYCIKKTLLKSMPPLMRLKFKLRFIFQKDIDLFEIHK